jgi:hypothetical protein
LPDVSRVVFGRAASPTHHDFAATGIRWRFLIKKRDDADESAADRRGPVERGRGGHQGRRCRSDRRVTAAEVDGRIFLGTQADYRDQRNLAIAIDPAAFRGLMRRHGAPLTEKLKGKHLLVGGFARPVRISINENGRPTGKYYYQTHVTVTDANQIEVVDE